jgi:hypothetical protein
MTRYPSEGMLFGPSAVTVHDYGDVLGQFRMVNLFHRLACSFYNICGWLIFRSSNTIKDKVQDMQKMRELESLQKISDDGRASIIYIIYKTKKEPKGSPVSVVHGIKFIFP